MPANDLRHFAQWLDHERYAANTIRVYGDYTRAAAVWMIANHRTLRTALTEMVRQWWDSLPPHAPVRNQARNALLAYYRSVDRHPNPAVELPRVRPRRYRPRPLQPDQRAAFLAAARSLGGVHEVLTLMFFLSGCRISELQRARWEHVDLESGTWEIHGKGSHRQGERIREVPLHSAVVPVLRRWRSSCPSPEWLFPTSVEWSAHPFLSTCWIRAQFAEVGALAGVRAVPHQARHTLATGMVDADVNLRVVQEVLGHASVATTQVYTEVSEAKLRAAVESLPGWDGAA